MLKLVAIDLDGTLLNSDKQISNRNREAIVEAQKHGIIVAISSGRFLGTAVVYAKECGVRYVIACNGALVYDLHAGKCLYENLLNASRTMEIVEFLDRANISYNVFTNEKLYIKQSQLGNNYYVLNNSRVPERLRVNYNVFDKLASVLDKVSVTKIEVYSQDVEYVKKVKELAGTLLYEVDITSSGADNFDIVAKGVNKGCALKFLASSLNISREEIAAIGDNENDCSMINYAGFGIAMSNGTSEIKNVADIITASNDEDGVAQILGNCILPNFDWKSFCTNNR